MRLRAALFVLMLFVCCTVPAFAQLKVVAESTQSSVAAHTTYPGLIQVKVTKDDKNVADDTEVTITRIIGDADLVDENATPHTLSDSVKVKTKDGVATATVAIGTKPRNFFTASVTVGGATKKLDDPLEIDSGDLPNAPPSAACKKVREVADGKYFPDDRCRTNISIYTGMVVDSFAAQVYNKYVNANDSNDLKTSFIAGVDAEQYIGGNNFVFLETVNGVRSASVTCPKPSERTNPDIPNPPVCQDNSAQITNDKFVYILRNARSLEAFVGFRHEFPGLRDTGRLYLRSELGFIDVAGLGGDIVDNHTFLALGYLTADDRFKGSYVEAGFGKSDIFDSYENRRFKFDGYLTAPIGASRTMDWFLQMTVDSDFRSGPDSVQIYMGLDFNLRNFGLKF